MINLIKRLLFFKLVSILFLPLFAFSSSSYLISQSAYKNHDYESTILNYDPNNFDLSEQDLLDKVIAAVIIEDISLANRIASKILEDHKDSQEAYIVKLTYLLLNKEFNKIKEIQNKFLNKNEIIDFIFFNNENLNDNSRISNALVDIVISSYSSNDQLSLNYFFLLY